VPEPQRSRVLGYFETRFGIPVTAFVGYHLLERRKTYVLLPAAPCLADLASLKVHHVGLPLLRKIRQHLKPTTAALQRFGAQASRNILDLSAAQVTDLLRTAELALAVDLSPGYVVLRHAGRLLGCGLYTPGRLRSQIPLRLVQHQRFPATPEALRSSPCRSDREPLSFF
jgi:NOL1/NOP2/fmu family ribosome biogenesis protein